MYDYIKVWNIDPEPVYINNYKRKWIYTLILNNTLIYTLIIYLNEYILSD